MNNIGLIDDRNNQRKSFMRKLNLRLEALYPDWKIIDSKPFKTPEEYRQWVLENEISVLIIDERLNEESLADGTYAPDLGSEVVKKLRDYFKDLPIYCITNIDITEELKSALQYFNLILSRSKFDADLDNYLNSFIRSGIIFYTAYKEELALLGELSEKIAKGIATVDEVKEAHSLQMRLVIPHLTEELTSREVYLKDLETQIDEIKKLQQELLNSLNQDKK
jgi:hypothetical protein